MKQALIEAEKCLLYDDVPVGCVIVKNNQIIAKAYNTRIKNKNAICHCEILAISKACEVVGDWRLDDCTMYVTLEPCPMCAGAIVQSRIKKVVIGARNKKSGCCGSILNILQYDGFNHKVAIEYDVMMQDCSNILIKFFKRLRKNEKKDNTI